MELLDIEKAQLAEIITKHWPDAESGQPLTVQYAELLAALEAAYFIGYEA